MNFKKTLGLVLTAALVSTSLVAVKPVKAAAPVVATAPTSINFKYFFPQRSLLVAGEADTYVVDTDYAGKVQYEFWVKDATNKDAKWTVISKGADGKPGYTEAVDGKNTPYAIPLVDGFTFNEGKYYTAVYVKAVGSKGTINYHHYMDATTGVDTGDAKTGTEQTCDAVNSGYFNALNKSYKDKYNEMLGDFMFDANSFVKGQKVTFKGFSGQKANAKYKLVFRKIGEEAKTQVVVNPTSFQSSVVWDLKDVTPGTYQLIAWSEPVNAGKDAARDGWAIDSKYVTVTEASQKAAVDASSIELSDGPIAGQTFVSLKLAGVTDATGYTVKLGDTTFKYYPTKGVFAAVVSSTDAAKLKDATSYTVTEPVKAAAVDTSSIELSDGPIAGQTFVSLKLAGVTDGSAYAVKFGDTTFKYYPTKGVFAGVVSSTDTTKLKNAASYTVSAAQ